MVLRGLQIIIRDSLGLPDDIARERIWRSYRQGWSPGSRWLGAAQRFTDGQDRSGTALASELRSAPVEDLVTGVTKLLHAVRDNLTKLKVVLINVSRESIATRQLGTRM